MSRKVTVYKCGHSSEPYGGQVCGVCGADILFVFHSDNDLAIKACEQRKLYINENEEIINSLITLQNKKEAIAELCAK